MHDIFGFTVQVLRLSSKASAGTTAELKLI